jgi:hypothetical protein
MRPRYFHAIGSKTAGRRVAPQPMFTNLGITLSTMSPIRVGNRTVYIQTCKGYTTIFWQDSTLFCDLVSDLPLPAMLEAL